MAKQYTLRHAGTYDSVKHKYTCQGYIALTAHFIDVGWKFENFGTGMATHEVHSSFIQHHEICKLVLRNHLIFTSFVKL
jgi:hypothetical protein